VERALGRARSGGGAFAIDADRKTYQCGLSQCSLDPSRQHHDARAGHHSDTTCGASAGTVIDCQCAIAVGASEFDAHSRAGSSEDERFRTGVGQKAADAKGSAHGAGSARAGGAASASTSGCGSRSRERLILPKAVADR
jgi:hypothetical protein